MNILYGVVGEGMGHATRSRVVLEHLLARGHAVRVVASGRATAFLRGVFGERLHVLDIEGLSLEYGGNALALGRSVRRTLRSAPKKLARNIAAYRALEGSGFRP